MGFIEKWYRNLAVAILLTSIVVIFVEIAQAVF